jgi:hypothetical protein
VILVDLFLCLTCRFESVSHKLNLFSHKRLGNADKVASPDTMENKAGEIGEVEYYHAKKISYKILSRVRDTVYNTTTQVEHKVSKDNQRFRYIYGLGMRNYCSGKEITEP